jgi:3-phosphoshikimate 1-carboxyvinyltransferase
MTLGALRDFGADVEELPPGAHGDRGWRVGGRLHGRDMVIEPDLSGGAPFLAAALVAGGRVTVAGWPAATTQPGDLQRDYLTACGAEVSWSPDGLSATATRRPRGADLDLTPAGELAPTLAAIATVADGPSRLKGIGHLRGHETDRIAALRREITRLGGGARELADGLEIVPGPLRPAVVETYGDHRMAMFAAIVGLVVDGVEVRDVATTAKTMPDFPQRWRAMAEAQS